VICSLSDKKMFRTAIAYENLDPTWNHGPEEMVLDHETKLMFEVRDKDMLGSKPLGKKTLSRDECLKGFEGPLSLGKGNGSLYVRVKPLSKSAAKKPFKLRVSVIRARDLRDADLFGHSDPYVQCKVRGKLLFQTDVIWDNTNPEWNHPPEDIELIDARDLKFDVYDKDLIGQGDFLGSAMLSSEMCESGFEGELSLGVGNGVLQVKVERLERLERADTALAQPGKRGVADVGIAMMEQVRSGSSPFAKASGSTPLAKASGDSPLAKAKGIASERLQALMLPLVRNGSSSQGGSPAAGRSSPVANGTTSGGGTIVPKAVADCNPGATFQLIRSKIREYLSPAPDTR